MSVLAAGLRFGFLALASAFAPQETRVAIEQDSLANLRMLKNFTFPTNGLPPNLAQLQDKMPKGLLGFLRRQDKLHGHHHIGTKEEHAKHRADFTLELLRLFRPCANCSRYQRYGSAHDGGYVMCDELMGGINGVYSFGINGNDDWGAAVSRRNDAPVYQFDCYHKGVACPAGHDCELFHFVPECLGLAQDETRVFRSLEEHLERLTPLHGRPTPRGGDLLLKVDVEGKEWNAFTNARLKDLRRMRQIVVEFHAIAQDEFHDAYVNTLKRILKAGFVVAHIHGNNNGPMALFGNGRFKLADDVEVTFINTLALSATVDTNTCRTTQMILQEDAVANPFNFDLPMPLLPSENDIITPAHVRVLTCRWWCGVYAHILYVGPFVLVAGFMLIWSIACTILLVGPSKEEWWKRFGGIKGYARRKDVSSPEGDDI